MAINNCAAIRVIDARVTKFHMVFLTDNWKPHVRLTSLVVLTHLWTSALSVGESVRIPI